jgi:hypothetical protein
MHGKRVFAILKDHAEKAVVLAQKTVLVHLYEIEVTGM